MFNGGSLKFVMVDRSQLHIAVNGLPLMAVHTGIARYLKSLYRWMGESGCVTVDYVLPGRHSRIAPEGARQGGKLDFLLSLPPPVLFGMRAAQWHAYELYLGYAVKRLDIDVVHESFYTPAKFRRHGAKQVFTLHDLSMILFAETHSRDRRMFFNHFFQTRLSEADAIIVPSYSVKKDLENYGGVDLERVAVIHEGVDSHFYPRSDETVRSVIARYDLPSEYLLFVGTLEPRKNLSRLLKALAGTKATLPLVIAGWSGWGDPVFQEELKRLGLDKRIYFTGYVDDDELAALYSGAQAFLYPSLYEGFGLPVLEAMACGCPVVSSDAASLPEVVGDAAVTANPFSTEEWINAIDEMVFDGGLRNKMISAGLTRVKDFTWQSAAKSTLELFREVYSNTGG